MGARASGGSTRAVILASLLALAIGCSLTSSLDGLTTGVAHGPGVGPADPGVPTEAGAVVEAGADAHAPFCSGLTPPPRLCVDFDDRILFRAGTARHFERELVHGTATGSSLDDTSFGTLAPSAKFQATAAGTTMLARTFADRPTRVVYSLRMRVDPGPGQLDLCEMRLGQDDEFNIFLRTDGPRVSFLINGAVHPAGYEVRAGEWHRYEMVADARTSTFQASLDGVLSLTVPVDLSSVRSGLQIIAGATWADDSATIWTDDILVDF